MTAKRTQSKSPRSTKTRRRSLTQRKIVRRLARLERTEAESNQTTCADNSTRCGDDSRNLCGVLPGIFFEAQSTGDASSVRVELLGPGAEEFFGVKPQAIIDRPRLLSRPRSRRRSHLAGCRVGCGIAEKLLRVRVPHDITL